MKTTKILFFFAIALIAHQSTFAITYTVSSVTGTGPGTFTDAINTVNGAGAGPHTINFTGLTGTGPWVYAPGSPIPDVNVTVIIDGGSAPGYSCVTGPMFIVVGPGYNDFQVNGANSIIRAISFRGHQVELNASGIQMYGCWFNLNDNGTAGAGGDPNGPFLIMNNCDNCIVGGAGCGLNNVISANGNAGSASGMVNISGGTTITISYLYVGTSASGNIVLNNSTGECIRIDGTTPSLTFDHCVIAGAKGNTPDGYGLNFNGTHNNLTISNSMIGVPASGSVAGNAAFGNDKAGIYFLNASGTNININSNIICNNGRNSVTGQQVDDSGLALNGNGTISGIIQNNYVGVDPSNNLGGNRFYGIYMYANVNGMTIRTNVVGDNGNNSDPLKYGGGITAAVGSVGNINIMGNYIGVSPTGADIGNYNSGIHLESVTVSPSNIVIGTSAAADRNYIGFNKGNRTTENAGIYIFGTTGVTIQNNYIGLTPTGTSAGQKNGGGAVRGGAGILCSGNGALRIRIGGTAANTQNYICHNLTNGVQVYNASDYVEMNYNSMYCNGAKAINLFCGANQGNNGFGCTTLTATGVGAQPYASITGNKPANSQVDVFGTALCALGSGSCLPQQQYRYGGVAASAATTYTYNHGSAMYDDLSVDATGTGGDCSSSYCRTSELLCIDNPLPVKWLNFTITPQQSNALLNWSTATETGNKEFIIERSSNGIEFISIGIVNGAINSNVVQSYLFTDTDPLSGISYYRLHQVDVDGESSYSKTLTYNVNTATQITVAPVPNNGEFDAIVTTTNGEFTLTITDVLGREVYHTHMQNAGIVNTLHISIYENPGVYMIHLNSGNDYRMTKVSVE